MLFIGLISSGIHLFKFGDMEVFKTNHENKNNIKAKNKRPQHHSMFKVAGFILIPLSFMIWLQMTKGNLGYPICIFLALIWILILSFIEHEIASLHRDVSVVDKLRYPHKKV